MNKITLDNIRTVNNKVFYEYTVTGSWDRCFKSMRMSCVEYDTDVGSVPSSVLAVPFVCNILPAVWLCDATLQLNSLDSDFVSRIDDLKSGYKKMYPMLDFKGKIETTCESIVPPAHVGRKGALFFSGGVDAYTTFLRHLEEKPALMTVWGADIKLDDATGWKNVLDNLVKVSSDYGVENHAIKSDFRSVLNECELDRIIEASNDRWWHGFQNSIAIISHAAPLAYLYGWKKVYISSSFSEDIRGQYTGCSDPSIDNNIVFCGCHTVHDGYELNRQQKIGFLVDERHKSNIDMFLRVCWESRGGKNCSCCEKCYRTILGLVAEGEDPNDYGFSWSRKSSQRCRKDLLSRYDIYEYDYYPIQQRMKENVGLLTDSEDYRWFIELDIDSVNHKAGKRIRRVLNRGIIPWMLRSIRGDKADG